MSHQDDDDKTQPPHRGKIDREQLLTTLADRVPALIAYYDIVTLRCVFANRAYAEFNGWTAETALGRTVREIIGETAWVFIKPQVAAVQRGETVQYEREQVLPDGAKRQIEVNLIPHLNRAGEQIAAFVLINDISRHHQIERALKESEERLAKFVAASNEGIFFHENGVVTDVNDAALRMGGRTAGEVVGHSTLNFVAPECRQAVQQYIESGAEARYESFLLHKDGRHIPVEFTGRTMMRNGVGYRMGTMLDISERKQAEERIRYLAHHDALTGLPNRVLLLEQLESLLALARRRSNQLAVLFLDLDHFKTVNDSLGHHAGDLLLTEVARRLRAAVRDADVVARQGGDEFLIVMADIAAPADAAAVAAKLLAAVTAPFDIEGHTVSVAPSIGISAFPRDGTTADELIRNADSAMYSAKGNGRGQYQFFTKALSDAAFDALGKESALREAVRNGDFVLHYQPQISLATSKITGVEALVRWRRADGKLIGPNEFIAFAEERGLIGAIGRWVLAEACRQNKEWQAAGLPKISVAVNVSPLQFKSGDLVADVERVLRRTGLESQYLELELTEGALMSSSMHVTGKFKQLRTLGVKLSIDDFGTGYSSLGYLKRYRVDKLKIDRTFVRDIETDADDVAIARAIVQMGKTLNLTVLAEGVENQGQLDLLRAQGCDEFQGFLLSEPLLPDAAAEIMRRHPAEDLAITRRLRTLTRER